MKTIRRLLALACALVAALAVAVPAYAVGSHTITINSDTGGHTFTAYQIFSGEYDDTVGGLETLSNIQWGSGVDDSKALSALKADTTIGNYFTSCNSAADVAAVLQNAEAGGTKVFADNSDAIDAFAAVISRSLSSTGMASKLTPNSTYEYTITGLDDGYYLVMDAIDSGSTTGNAYSKFMIQLVGNVEVNAKADVPTITKKVTDINDTTGATATGDSADYDIGDDVPFTITATVVENLADYNTYKYVIHDKLASGLMLNKESVKVMVDQSEITTGYELVTDNLSDDCSFEVKFSNLKTVSGVSAGTTITVTYTAELGNTNAVVIGGNGNDNTAKLEYSSNPNDTTGATTSKTVSDTVTVFTYQVIIKKVDDQNQPLDGAAFKLEKKVKGAAGAEDAWELVEEITAGTNKTQFTIKGLDDGTYKLTETNTPTGYNTMEPVEFTIEAAHDSESADPKLTDLAGTVTDGSLTFTSSTTDGSLTATVVNERGATLPSTGGIGKTVLIGMGAVIAVVAVVGLVTKYRASRMD